ncbi:hypothetical protein [Sphingobacterium thalpophilum]|uniref:hypothetical protein n=1 Tax=Sphingobacterium thalpophilum TaxID=259 RepID=UPI003D995B23
MESDLDKSAQNSLQLAFMELGTYSWQEQGKLYAIIPASSGKLRSLSVPDSQVKSHKVTKNFILMHYFTTFQTWINCLLGTS